MNAVRNIVYKTADGESLHLDVLRDHLGPES